ncbi:hypothetical protein K458DRAFT_485000 [Lentithecium fluviatile CBS 122367]|uniref:Uncharacterized protein n=1 Tax=Lentithecium fluviatile CBS 122367 TaxID=1168545 RepID=A0A6G1JB71_9PLEO|nr:hypothetical protein K458DRAFT_485000 [Lentithecium fluviatile CBS 122367]
MLLFSLTLQLLLFCTAFAALTPASSIPSATRDERSALSTPRLSNADHPIELRALPSQPPTTLETKYITPVVPEIARAETTIAPKIIGYTSTQGVFSPFNCHSGTYFAVSGYARCCFEAQTDCPVYTATGTDSQTVCVTGTIFETVGDSDPKFMVGCWPSWTGGDWKATRTVPSEEISAGKGGDGGGSLTKRELAGIIVGAIFGLALLVAMGVFAAKFYNKLRRTLIVLEGQAQEPVESGPGGSGASVTAPEPVYRPSQVLPPIVGNALEAKGDSQRRDSARTMSNTSAIGSKNVVGMPGGGSLDETPEVSGDPMQCHELAVRQPEAAWGTAESGGVSPTPAGAQESVRCVCRHAESDR